MPISKKKFSKVKEVRKLARERVGIVPVEKIIIPKASRKPKHRKLDTQGTE